jgi:Flp pilus assembly protein protease CpaA
MVSGKIDSFSIQYVITCSAIFAALTDIIWGKIYNYFTLSLSLAGIITLTTFSGFGGLWHSLLGIAGSLLLYGWMFKLGHMGGGDVKFLMALGAWGGLYYAFEVALLGIFLGGVISILTLLFKGRMTHFWKRTYASLLSIFIKELEFEPIKIDRELTMPFGIPLSIAAVWVLYQNPLRTWGLLPW